MLTFFMFDIYSETMQELERVRVSLSTAEADRAQAGELETELQAVKEKLESERKYG